VRQYPSGDTPKWVEEFDQLALRGPLYGLTEEEIDTVEGKK